MIVPDLPVDEATELESLAAARQIDVVLLAAPGTTPERYAAIGSASRRFRLLRRDLRRHRRPRGARRRRRARWSSRCGRTPICRCWSASGSRRRRSAAAACAFADGVIVGSALMSRLLEDDRDGLLELAAALPIGDRANVMRVVDAAALRRALPMHVAIDALRTAFAREDPSLASPMRTTLATAAGTLLTMPAAGDAGVGVKLVTLSEFNPQKGLPFVQATYVLFDVETQRPQAVIDGTELTAIRTGAVSGRRDLVPGTTRRRPDSCCSAPASRRRPTSRRCVRSVPIAEVVVVSRSAAHAEALVATAQRARARGEVGRAARTSRPPISSAPAPPRRSRSSAGEDLAAGAHVNAIGASLPDRRELDTEAIRRCEGRRRDASTRRWPRRGTS